LIIFAIIIVLFLVVQLLFCFLAKRTSIKLIPVYVITFCLLLAGLLYTGVFGEIGTGFLSAEKILAILLAMGSGAALAGDTLAWGVYGFVKRKRV